MHKQTHTLRTDKIMITYIKLNEQVLEEFKKCLTWKKMGSVFLALEHYKCRQKKLLSRSTRVQNKTKTKKE